jgi:two-component system sensor histidine kinase RpfC
MGWLWTDTTPMQAMRANPELQSALVRIGFWLFAVSYVGLGAFTGYYRVDREYYFALFAIYLLLFMGMLVSVLMRPEWEARRYVGLALDITAVSLAIFLTREAISPFYLIYIWIFISYGTRYGRTYLVVASTVSVLAYNLVLVALNEWHKHTYEAVFFLLLLVILPLYQHSLLRKLQLARREAESANKAKGDFLAVMTHELRTPLTGVIGMTNLLQSTPLSTEQREYVDSIAGSAEVLRALIGDILDLSKIEAHRLTLESISFDARAAILDVCNALQGQALAKGLELIIRVDPNVPSTVAGDLLRVRQILFNLLGNAIKFTHQGEVVVSVSARPAEDDLLRPHLLLEVTDTGIGIPREKLDAIFESFWQADDSTTRRYGGTGLGTTIARDLTRLMGGRIAAESEVGKGSRFCVRLPILRDVTCSPAQPVSGRPLAGSRALVYEQNATSRQLILEICADAGMDCQAADDIGRLSRMADGVQRPNLVIIADAPDRQDLQALLGLFHRVVGREVPHLFLTYRARRGDQQPDCPNCLNKPFLRDALVAQVERVLGREIPGPSPEPLGDPSGPQTASGRSAVQGARVLIAEDNEIAAKVISTLLAKQGVNVIRVRDGEEALRHARDERFDAALVDLRMPKLDGIEFTRAYRNTEAPGDHLPIIALTANAAEDAKVQCQEAGMDAFLAKPVRPQELTEMVHRFAVKTGAVG